MGDTLSKAAELRGPDLPPGVDPKSKGGAWIEMLAKELNHALQERAEWRALAIQAATEHPEGQRRAAIRIRKKLQDEKK